ncbi:MAG: transglutaminase-like domain-containing protein [Arenimonas sp.]|nr:transglutaminase-like domain-containing protein [Arenimonas sp.]
MSIAFGTPRSWLEPTGQLDLSHPKIHITAQKLTQARQSLPARAAALHDFVRRLPFGAQADAAALSASEVLRAGRGDCHSKGLLFVALCRAAGIPARLQFVRVRTRFLHGILDDGPDTMPHAVGQVLLGGRWVSTDGYVVDPVLFVRARERLEAGGLDCGWGIVRDAEAGWLGSADCLQQFRPADVAHHYGAYHDVAEFYDERSQDDGSPSWLARLKYAVGASLVNRRVQQLRAQPVAEAVAA